MTLDYGNYGIFLTMVHAGIILSTVLPGSDVAGPARRRKALYARAQPLRARASGEGTGFRALGGLGGLGV